MRLTFDQVERYRAIAEEDPLPPDDRSTRSDPPVFPALENLYRTQAPRLLRFFSRRADRQDASDLVQESFARFVAACEADASRPRVPEAYLSQIATNLLRNRAREAFHRSVSRNLSADDISLPANDFVATIEARDVLIRVDSAVARLRPKTREIFMAHRLDGLSYKEIGEKFGLGVKGVEWHMSKAIAQIARAVGPR